VLNFSIPQGAAGAAGATGSTGAAGSSGVISVTAPLTNSGTSSSAVLGITTGTTASTVCAGNDSRLSDARTPTSHAASHASGGADALSLAASQIASGTLVAARLPIATTSTLGGVIAGAGLTVDGSGNLTVNERLLTSLTSATTSATTAEASVASVSLTGVANDVIRGRVVASVVNNSGASVTYTWRVKLGATTILTLSNALATNSAARTLIIDFAVNVISTTSQVAGAWMAIGFNNLGATISAANGTATETLSSAKTLDVTFQMSSSTGSPSAPQYTFLSAVVERSKG
jgi:hypothetical protein